MEITAAMVRELREKSGAGMMDCKKALAETGGDLEQAFDHLRKAGLKSAEKKASREMEEGRVHSETTGSLGAMVEVTCETDFVARTPDFDTFVADLVGHAMEHRPADAGELLSQTWKGGGTVQDSIKQVVGKLGENISVSRVVTYENTAGRVASYIHHNDKVGVLVSVATDKGEEAEAILKDLCFHIAFHNPECLAREELDANLIEREKGIFQAEVADKPENIREKIVAGKLEKFYAERVLPEQRWVRDDKLTVQKALEQALGSGTRIEAFSRFGIE